MKMHSRTNLLLVQCTTMQDEERESIYVVNLTCRCKRECAGRQQRRPCEQLQYLELRRRKWLVLQCNVGWSYPASWQGE